MSDADTLLLGVGPATGLLIGIALFWMAGTLRGNSEQAQAGASLLRVLGGIAIALAFLAGLLFTTAHLVLLIAPIAFLIAIVALRRYYAMERQSLLWGLILATERGIPLDTAARAFAEERNDRLRLRGVKLADYLEAGVPLGLALRRSGHAVDPDVALAADLGSHSGGLGTALRSSLQRAGTVDAVVTPIASRFVYVGIILFQLLIISFLMLLRTMPIMERMFHELDHPLPDPTEQLIGFYHFASPESWLWWGFILAGLAAGCLGTLWLLGFSFRRLPGLRWFWWRVHCSWVLRWLATGVRQRRSIVDMLRMLAGYFPESSLRRRLDRAAGRVEQGAHWCDALQRSRIIRRRDGNVFRAAERAGNLAWALDEMADHALRRWSYRVRNATNIVFPLLIVSLGAVVLITAVGAFLPLVSLIEGHL